ncbi:MAG: nucleic acid-binding protein [Propionibacterium sp.]|nr:nucleic acid-binding protein [Propionibacterium sp.]
MLAERSAQVQLLRLTDLDAEMARVKHAAQSLPQHQAIQSLMEQRQQAGDNVTALTTNADDLEVATRRAEADLVPVRARLERNQERIDGGSISDAKVLRGLIDETEHLKGRISDLEDEQLEIMGQAEEAVAAREEAANRKVSIEDDLRGVVAERDEAVAGLQEEAKSIAATRQGIATTLPANLLGLYEKLRASTGLGAARLVRGRCGGCQLELTVADRDRFRKAPDNEVLRCVECDRILLRVEESF